uniref:G_PROTEIN_RECEP_F1_2 domain-containing protein n=1 Tax=Panagrellus redivivus TaxID=6233 RepID=A0A7E4WCC5_PANRE
MNKEASLQSKKWQNIGTSFFVIESILFAFFVTKVSGNEAETRCPEIDHLPSTKVMALLGKAKFDYDSDESSFSELQWIRFLNFSESDDSDLSSSHIAFTNDSTIMCKASFSIVYVTATGSFYFMSLVAIDRWLAIFRRKSRLSKRKCIWLTTFVWLIALTVASPYLYLSGEVHTLGDKFFNPLLTGEFPELLPDRIQCGIDCPSCKRLLQVTTIIAQYGVPLFVMIPTYGHLAFFLWHRPTVGVQSRERSRKAQHRRRRMLLTLLAIVGFLILCWSPLFSVGVLHAYKMINNDSLSIYIYTSMIALLGVVITPCFYLLNDGFRKQILLIMPCCQHQNTVQNTKTMENTSNLENVLRNQDPERDYRSTRQSSPLLPSSAASAKQTSTELITRLSGSDITNYSPRKNSFEFAELPSKYSLDARSALVQL